MGLAFLLFGEIPSWNVLLGGGANSDGVLTDAHEIVNKKRSPCGLRFFSV